MTHLSSLVYQNINKTPQVKNLIMKKVPSSICHYYVIIITDVFMCILIIWMLLGGFIYNKQSELFAHKQ